MGRSFMALGRYVDAAVTLRRLVDRFPDSALAPTARIELVRSLRLGEDYVAAQAAMGLVRENPEGIDPSDILYERALIALGRGEHEQAFDLLRELLREDPGYAREHRVALRFADEELEAGRYDAAVDAYRTYRDETADPAREEEVTLKIARALARAGREREAIAAYEDLLAGALPDTVQARIYAERGALYAELERWDDATADLKRAAELAPGTLTASQATLGRARIAWRVRGQREAALEVFLDAFLHAPRSAFADSARTSARAVARILHFQRLADGGVVVAGLDDPALVRSTALYRLAEEVRESEKDPEGSVEIFDSLIERFPDSPWTPRALLASGLLLRETGATDEGNARLERLIGTRPDDPAADSARLLLGEPLPERPEHFYDESQELERLVAALPDLQDPMVAIADQMDRYVTRQEPAIRGGLNRGLDRPTGGNATGAEPVPPRQEPLPGDRELPPGVTP